MYRYLSFIFLLVNSALVSAEQCPLQMHNELHENGGWIEIHKADGRVATLTENNSVQIDGKSVALDREQKQAIARYRADLISGIRQIRAYSNDAIAFLNETLNDVETSIELPGAFDDVKHKLNAFWQQTSDQYFEKNGETVLPKGAFEHVMNAWTKARSLFDDEFIVSVWNSLSEKMKDENGVNLTAMASVIDQLKTKIEARWHEHDIERHQQEKALCDSMNQLIKEEQELHQKIPELKDYQLFTI